MIQAIYIYMVYIFTSFSFKGFLSCAFTLVGRDHIQIYIFIANYLWNRNILYYLFIKMFLQLSFYLWSPNMHHPIIPLRSKIKGLEIQKFCTGTKTWLSLQIQGCQIHKLIWLRKLKRANSWNCYSFYPYCSLLIYSLL